MKAKARWAVEKLKGKFQRTVHRYVKEEGDDVPKLKTEVVTQDRGWMVYFPSGNSIHIYDPAEMKRHGFMDENGKVRMAGYVDMETGLPVDVEVDPLTEYKRRAHQHGASDDFATHLEAAE